MPVSPCIWEKLEVVLLRYVVNRWWWYFSCCAKRRFRWMMLGNVTFCAIVALGVFINFAQVQVLLLAVGCFSGTALTWLVAARTIDESAIGMTGPVRTWLRELGTSIYADEDLALLEELSEAITGADLMWLLNVLNRASPDLRDTALFRALRNDVEAVERAVQRSRRRS